VPLFLYLHCGCDLLVLRFCTAGLFFDTLVYFLGRTPAALQRLARIETCIAAVRLVAGCALTAPRTARDSLARALQHMCAILFI
jgi:hypothetical protein